MRTTRSKKNGTTVHPYERPLDRGRWIRETSFTGWEGMNNAAIVRVTETLDKDLALLDQEDEEAVEDRALLELDTPSNTMEAYSMSQMQVTDGTTTVGDTDFEVQMAVPLQGTQGSQQYSTVLIRRDDDLDDRFLPRAARHRQKNQYPGMVSWSSHKDVVVACFEKQWETIQDYCIEMRHLCSQISNKTIWVMFDQFTRLFELVYDKGNLRLGSASFLFDEWELVAADAVKRLTGTSTEKFLEGAKVLSGLLNDFKNMEPDYDAILA